MDRFMQDYLDARVGPMLDLTASCGNPELAERGRRLAGDMEQLASQCGDAGEFEARLAQTGLLDQYNQAYAEAYMAGGTSSVLPAVDPNASTVPEFTADDAPAMQAAAAEELKRAAAYEVGDTIGFEIKQAVKEATVYPVGRAVYEKSIHAPIVGDMMRAENDLWQVGQAVSLGKKLFGRKKRGKDDGQDGDRDDA